MNKPTVPPPPLPRSVAALVTLLAETAEVPELAGLHGEHAHWQMDSHGLAVRVFQEPNPLGFLNACADRYDGTIRNTTVMLTGDAVLFEVAAIIDGVRVSINAPIGGRSLESRLRRRVAELEAQLGNAPGELAESEKPAAAAALAGAIL